MKIPQFPEFPAKDDGNETVDTAKPYNSTTYGPTNEPHRSVPSVDNAIGAIDMCAAALLKRATDDYGSRIYQVIRDDVIADVKECSAFIESRGVTQGDVALAIGRALCKRLNIEY